MRNMGLQEFNHGNSVKISRDPEISEFTELLATYHLYDLNKTSFYIVELDDNDYSKMLSLGLKPSAV